MKNIIFLLILSFSTLATASDTFTYILKENQKYENSFSVNIANEATLHLVVVKNKETRMYDLLSFFMDAAGTIKELATTSFNDEPEPLSYHKTGNTITLLGFQDKTLSILDYNLENGEILKMEMEVDKKPESVFVQENAVTIIISDKNGENIEIVTIENTQAINKKSIVVPKDYQNEIDNIFNGSPDIVDTNEFVKNGSISENQAYFSDGKFIVVNNEKQDENMNVLIIDPNATNPIAKKNFTSSKLDKVKDSNNQVIDGKLFGMFLGKKDFSLSIFDLVSGAEEKNFLMSEDIAKMPKMRNTETYIEEATRSKMRPTVSVNKTKKGNYAVVLDYVNKDTYRFYNDGMFMHMLMMQAMMHQNMIMSRPSGFGPNPIEYEMDDLFFAEKSIPLYFTLDKDLNLLDENDDKTVHQYVDKEKYINILKANKNQVNPTVGFLENEYRYMYTDKKEEKIFIQKREIKRRKK